jgi:hypothetical protein
MGVRSLGLREVMGLLPRLRQEKGTIDTMQVTDQLPAEHAD